MKNGYLYHVALLIERTELMGKAQSSTEMPLEWFTVEEAAYYLRVSKRTIYKWTKDGRLHFYLIGNHRHRRYRKDDLDKVPRRVEKSYNSKTSTGRAF